MGKKFDLALGQGVGIDQGFLTKIGSERVEYILTVAIKGNIYLKAVTEQGATLHISALIKCTGNVPEANFPIDFTSNFPFGSSISLTIGFNFPETGKVDRTFNLDLTVLSINKDSTGVIIYPT